MKQENTDSAIIEILKSTYGIITNKAKYDERESLVTLDISNKGLTELPEELWQLSSLHMLNLSGNKLTQISEKIGWLKSLRWLYLQENKLKQVPGELGQ